MIKINCKHNEKGAWCTNKEVKRSLFGFGARCCSEFDNPFRESCKYRESYRRPNIIVRSKS